MANRSIEPNGHKPDDEAGASTPAQDAVRRDILPIPDVKHVA